MGVINHARYGLYTNRLTQFSESVSRGSFILATCFLCLSKQMSSRCTGYVLDFRFDQTLD